MRSLPRLSIASVALATLMAACGYAVENPGATGEAPPGGPLGGRPVPSFSVRRLDDGAASLASFKGRYILANLWATWCPPCRHEMPALERLSRAYASRNLTVVGIDQGEGETTVRHYIRSIGITYPILLDSDQRYGTAFGALGLPTSVFVGADGTVMMQVDGELSYQRMVQLVDRLIRPRAASPQASSKALKALPGQK